MLNLMERVMGDDHRFFLFSFFVNEYLTEKPLVWAFVCGCFVFMIELFFAFLNWKWLFI